MESKVIGIRLLPLPGRLISPYSKKVPQLEVSGMRHAWTKSYSRDQPTESARRLLNRKLWKRTAISMWSSRESTESFLFCFNYFNYLVELFILQFYHSSVQSTDDTYTSPQISRYCSDTGKRSGVYRRKVLSSRLRPGDFVVFILEMAEIGKSGVKEFSPHEKRAISEKEKQIAKGGKRQEEMKMKALAMALVGSPRKGSVGEGTSAQIPGKSVNLMEKLTKIQETTKAGESDPGREMVSRYVGEKSSEIVTAPESKKIGRSYSLGTLRPGIGDGGNITSKDAAQQTEMFEYADEVIKNGYSVFKQSPSFSKSEFAKLKEDEAPLPTLYDQLGFLLNPDQRETLLFQTYKDLKKLIERQRDLLLLGSVLYGISPYRSSLLPVPAFIRRVFEDSSKLVEALSPNLIDWERGNKQGKVPIFEVVSHAADLRDEDLMENKLLNPASHLDELISILAKNSHLKNVNWGDILHCHEAVEAQRITIEQQIREGTLPDQVPEQRAIEGCEISPDHPEDGSPLETEQVVEDSPGVIREETTVRETTVTQAGTVNEGASTSQGIPPKKRSGHKKKSKEDSSSDESVSESSDQESTSSSDSDDEVSETGSDSSDEEPSSSKVPGDQVIRKSPKESKKRKRSKKSSRRRVRKLLKENNQFSKRRVIYLKGTLPEEVKDELITVRRCTWKKCSYVVPGDRRGTNFSKHWKTHGVNSIKDLNASKKKKMSLRKFLDLKEKSWRESDKKAKRTRVSAIKQEGSESESDEDDYKKKKKRSKK